MKIPTPQELTEAYRKYDVAHQWPVEGPYACKECALLGEAMFNCPEMRRDLVDWQAALAELLEQGALSGEVLTQTMVMIFKMGLHIGLNVQESRETKETKCPCGCNYPDGWNSKKEKP